MDISVHEQDLLAAVAHCPPRRSDSALALKQRAQALELARAEGLGLASFAFRIQPLERVEGPVLHLAGASLEAPWMLPASGTLTALACGVCTLGTRLEDRVRSLFAEGRRSLALALNTLGNEVLLEASRRMHHRMEAAAGQQGLTLSGELRSGDPGLALETQPAVLRLAGAGRIGVTVSSGTVMHPLKSTSGIFGVGRDLPKARWSRCDSCRFSQRCSVARAA